MNLKSKFLIFMLILCILSAISCVSAADDNLTETLSDDMQYHSFTELNESISQSDAELNLAYDYKYDNESGCAIHINKESEFTLNGNGHAIDGIDEKEVLSVHSSQNVIINNLTFRNCVGTIFPFSSSVVFNDVKFINCSGCENDPFLN